eukprot:6302580-Amphidinium_carterae.5
MNQANRTSAVTLAQVQRVRWQGNITHSLVERGLLEPPNESSRQQLTQLTGIPLPSPAPLVAQPLPLPP